MADFISSDSMRRLEAEAIESGRVTGLELMERAGAGVVAAILAEWPALAAGARAVVLCGPGNNGGDGFVVARLLRARGWAVTVWLYGAAAGLPPDARRNHDAWAAGTPGAVRPLSFPQVTEAEAADLSHAAYGAPGPVVVVDALFGIGLTRPLSGLAPVLAACARHRGRAGVHHVSVDLPSGLAETGPLGAVFPADLTVTFHRQKLAHGQGGDCCGHIVVQDIGLGAGSG